MPLRSAMHACKKFRIHSASLRSFHYRKDMTQLTGQHLIVYILYEVRLIACVQFKHTQPNGYACVYIFDSRFKYNYYYPVENDTKIINSLTNTEIRVACDGNSQSRDIHKTPSNKFSTYQLKIYF